MKEIRYFYCPDVDSDNMLPQEEAEHAIRVLRLRSGDIISITDGKGIIYDAEIDTVGKRSCTYNIIEKHLTPKTWQGNIEVAIAPTKNMDRMEMFAEKATEIGFDGINFINCQFSERKIINVERIKRVVISAMKQSHKSYMPYVHELETFDKFIRKGYKGTKYIAHCNEDTLVSEHKSFLFDELKKNPQGNALVLIGPEGDFSVQEVQGAIKQGFITVSLGENRLRTETAALSAVFMMNLNNRIAK